MSHTSYGSCGPVVRYDTRKSAKRNVSGVAVSRKVDRKQTCVPGFAFRE